MERTVFLIDMDAYFASIEQAANPALRGKPIVVCGKGRTVVSAASYEARAFGVKTGMNLYDVKRRCPQAVYVYGNLDKYSHISSRIHKILLEFTDQVEVFSIDECFLDVTHRVERGVPALSIGRAIKERIREDVGVTCSIGIGPNKIVAKIASNLEKPDGLCEIKKEDIPAVFAELPVAQLQGVGVGKQLSAKFESMGIRTAGQLGIAPLDLLFNRFGIMGHHLKRLGNGENDSPVKKYWELEDAKSIGHSHTLPKDTRNIDVISSYMQMLSEKVGVRMREEGFVAGKLDVVVRYADFHTVAKQRSLASFLKHGYEIYKAGWSIFKEFLPLKDAVRLVGITASGLSRDNGQRYLFQCMGKREKLTEALDSINKKYGSFTVKPSSLLIAEKFRKQHKPS